MYSRQVDRGMEVTYWRSKPGHWLSSERIINATIRAPTFAAGRQGIWPDLICMTNKTTPAPTKAKPTRYPAKDNTELTKLEELRARSHASGSLKERAKLTTWSPAKSTSRR